MQVEVPEGVGPGMIPRVVPDSSLQELMGRAQLQCKHARWTGTAAVISKNSSSMFESLCILLRCRWSTLEVLQLTCPDGICAGMVVSFSCAESLRVLIPGRCLFLFGFL